MAWDETKTDMTVVGADLQLDEGYSEGSYETTSQDNGHIGWWQIYLESNVTESPAATGYSSYKIEINLSDDNIAWDGWILFQNGGIYSCRYHNLKITVYGEPASGQRPKITAFEDDPRPIGEEACPAPVTSVLNQPAGTETRGKRHIVGTGAGDWNGYDDYIVECLDGNTPSWLLVKPRKGQRIWNDQDDAVILYDENSAWVTCDARKLSNGHIYIPGWAISATGAGTWTITANNGQAMTCGFYDNWTGGVAANADEVDYQLTLSVGTYTILLFTREGPGQAIIDIDLDGPTSAATEVASFDCYAAGAALNIKKSDAGNVITEAGLYTLTARVDGRNGLANDWKADIGAIVLFRTA
jgi:hypothetical protein